LRQHRSIALRFHQPPGCVVDQIVAGVFDHIARCVIRIIQRARAAHGMRLCRFVFQGRQAFGHQPPGRVIGVIFGVAAAVAHFRGRSGGQASQVVIGKGLLLGRPDRIDLHHFPLQ
jgi:hypothetical protein